MAQIANDFEQINGLFDDTINAICHQIQAYTTSNESFTYLQMLCEADHTKFFESMEIKINDHETHCHWDLSCCVQIYLLALKQSWLFGHSNERDFPMERLTSIRLNYALMEVNKLGVKTTGILMLLLIHGLVFDFCLLWLRSTASNLKASVSFLHSLKQTWTYQFIWSFLQESIRLMFQMETGADMS